MPLVLIDTNLLIYLVDQNEPEKQARAKEVLNVLHLHNMGRIGVQNMAEFVQVAVRKLQPSLTVDKAIEWVDAFTQMYAVINLTPQIVLEAARGVRDYSLAYYDAQIWAAARLNQIPLIFSEDFQDGMVLEGVRFVNPFAAEFQLEGWF